MSHSVCWKTSELPDCPTMLFHACSDNHLPIVVSVPVRCPVDMVYSSYYYYYVLKNSRWKKNTELLICLLLLATTLPILPPILLLLLLLLLLNHLYQHYCPILPVYAYEFVYSFCLVLMHIPYIYIQLPAQIYLSLSPEKHLPCRL